jgi:hypothetical protein
LLPEKGYTTLMNELAISNLSGSRIVASGLQGEIPYLEVESDGQRLRALVCADPEGNGPGFLFGLALPDSPEIKAMQHQVRQNGDPQLRAELHRRWSEEYYRSACDLQILAVDPGDPEDDQEFPKLIVTFADQPGERTFALEVSADEEGNYGGYLAVEARD